MESRNSISRRSQSFQVPKDVNPLANDYAVQLLECEMELERHCTIENIERLVKMYQRIIEYYDFHGDLKYLDYQQRLHKIFIRANVLREIKSAGRLFQSKNVTPTGSPKNRQQTSTFESPQQRKAQAEKEKARLAVELTKQSQPVSTNIVRMVDGHKARSVTTTTKAIHEFESQEELLKQRLANRKNRPKKPKMQANTEEGDKSGGMPSEDIDKIESILENYYEQRDAQIDEIRQKYNKQIAEYEIQSQAPGDVYSTVAEKMRQTMLQEIEQVNQEFKNRRRASIERVRGVHSAHN